MSDGDPALVVGELGPRVLVLATPEAEAMCKPTGLNFAQLLTPFSTAVVNTPAQIPDTPQHRQEIQLHFKDLDDFAVVPNPVAIRRTSSAVARFNDVCGQWEFPTGSTSIEDYQTPWFHSYRKQFLRLLRPSEHDTLTHPLMHLIFCTVKSEHPITSISTANSSQAVKSLHSRHGFLDKSAPVACVLVVDKEDSQDDIDATLESIRDNFGANRVFTLKFDLDGKPDQGIADIWRNEFPFLFTGPIPESDDGEGGTSANTVDGGIPSDTEDPLAQMAEEEKSQQQRQGAVAVTAGITPDIIRGIQRLVQAFAGDALWPFVINTVIKVADEVQAIKKSKSAFATARKWFGRGDTSATPAIKADKYENDIRERRLADLYFLVQNYHQAHRFYNHVRRDYSSDRAHIHLTGAVEMMSVCQALMDTESQKSDFASDLSKAVYAYRTRCKAPLYAMRTCFVMTDLLVRKRHFARAAKEYLVEVSESSHLRSGLLNEQAAALFSCEGGMSRKAMFQLVLSAFRYHRANLLQHSLRCYAVLEKYFQSKGWDRIEHHIVLQSASTKGNLKRMSESLLSFAFFLTHCPASEAVHAEALSSFISTYNALQSGSYSVDDSQSTSSQQGTDVGEGVSSDPPLSLPLPIINSRSISVQLQVQELPGNVASFEELESAAAAFLNVPQIKQLAVLSDATVNTSEPVVVINEPIVVQFDVKNPLSAPLVLSDITLDCAMDVEGGPTSTSGDEATSLELSTMNEVEITPGQFMNVILSVTPLRTGKLNIAGIRYKLHSSNGAIATGKQPFVVRGRRLNNNRQQKLKKVYGPDYRLSLRVADACPLLTVKVGSLPSIGIAGQILTVDVEVKNVGKATVADTVCVFPRSILHPHIVFDDGRDPIYGTDNRIDLKQVARLSPGEEKLIRFCMRVSADCEVIDCFQIAYRGEKPPASLPYRVVKVGRALRIVHGPDTSMWTTHTSPSTALATLKFITRRVSVQPVVCTLSSKTMMLASDVEGGQGEKTHLRVQVGKFPSIATLPCVRPSHALSAVPASVDGPAEAYSSCASLNGEDTVVPASINPIFLKRPASSHSPAPADTLAVIWRADVKNRKDVDLYGVSFANLLEEPVPTVVFDPASIQSTTKTLSSSVQSVSPILLGSGFLPNEKLRIILPKLFSSKIEWLGKSEYRMTADASGCTKLQLTCVLLMPFACLEGVEVLRESGAVITVQPFVETPNTP